MHLYNTETAQMGVVGDLRTLVLKLFFNKKLFHLSDLHIWRRRLFYFNIVADILLINFMIYSLGDGWY